MSEEFVLGADDDALEVRVEIDWRERAHLLKLRFPVALDDPVATFEIPFGHLNRPVDGAEEPAQSWVDLSGAVDGAPAGLAVVNDAKHGYDVSPAEPGYDVSPAEPGRSHSIGVTAVRSPVYAWHDPRLLDPDGHYAYQDQGVQRFAYLLVPHGGDWRRAGLTRRAALLGSPVRAMPESFHDGDLPARRGHLDDGAGPVMVTAVKCHEDHPRDLVVRAVETEGRPATVTLDVPMAGVRITAGFGPSQIRTFRIPLDRPLDTVETDLIEADLPPGRRGGPFTVEAG
jgi:alpha-mannosidase